MDDINSDFVEAARLGNLDKVSALLQRGADINAKNDKGWTALTCAASYHKSDVLEFLINKGANMEEKDEHGRTAIMCAASWNGNIQSIKLLVKYGAKVHDVDESGYTLRDIAKRTSHYDVVDFLDSVTAGRQKQIIDDAKPALDRLLRGRATKINVVR